MRQVKYERAFQCGGVLTKFWSLTRQSNISSILTGIYVEKHFFYDLFSCQSSPIPTLHNVHFVKYDGPVVKS